PWKNPPGGGGRVRRFGEGRRPRGDLASSTVGGTTTEDAKSPLPGRDPVVSARRIGEAVADAAPGRVRLLLVDPDEVAGRQLQRQLHEFGAGVGDYLLKGRASRDLVARAVQYAIERERLLVAERESRRDAEAARSSA